MIETASGYLEKPITRADVKASFAGLRPLFNPQATGSAGSTAKVSREHAVIPEFGNMITVTGGKWTAYRKMAEHAMLVATLRHLIPPRLCVTKDLPIFCDPNWDHAALEIEAEAGDAADEKVVQFALYARDHEFARTPEDVLFRRLRLGQMNEARTNALLPKIAAAFGLPVEECCCADEACTCEEGKCECEKAECECKAEVCEAEVCECKAEEKAEAASVEAEKVIDVEVVEEKPAEEAEQKK